MTEHEKWMKIALEEAKKAAAMGEIPVGAVMVKDGKLLASAHNTREENHDVTGHAELNALREAGVKLGRYILSGCTLYVTLEPCVMCAAAIAQARPDAVVFGAFDCEQGGCGSVYAITSDQRLRGNVPVLGGVLREECETLLKDFFEQRRKI